MNRPQTEDYPQWYSGYINLVDGDVLEILSTQAEAFAQFVTSNADKADYAYAPGKWTIKEMFGHIIDTERIMVFRLTCFARGEKAAIPGFDEDQYVINAHFKDRSLESLCEEFVSLRKSNLFLLKSLNEEELNRFGNANGNEISVRALVFILAGHVMHHQKVIVERYL
ncbi:DinB family protein [Pedobacter chitinilyticus]|uniref:DinB family protein n=1 Tax=Pedobacter chitinilyticus TaxID=2233776 RepID=A0A443YV53_9SPHI|nr:DinB family protein [Pedobacter chitinilyticus]RWU07704.1 DinB family protein [Pedobacter chitinilyticus]